LRALAGYFGAAVPRLRRSADHVVATAFVWRHLLALLGEREGVRERADLEDWLQRPARRCARRFPLPRERRLELPDHPGVYRLLRAGGAVLYVGKASSLRQRVGGHFHAHAGRGERALEMLTQVREVSFTETETALEAALLEADEIKRLAPPFNVALAADGRQVRFATADLQETGERPDAVHVVGPLISPGPFGGLSALRALLAAGGPCAPGASARARAVGVEPVYAPAAGCFRSGFARFVGEHGPLKCPRDLLQLGARLWSRRLATAATGPEPGSEEGGEEETRASRRPAWTDERVVQALEETVLRAAHAVRRARWLTRLSECSLAWAEPGWERPRLLVIRGGTVTARGYLEPGVPVPPPPGHARTTAERRTSFDLSVFDRLRVLTTELRGLTAGAASLELRLGPSARLSRKRLQSVLRWV
jgi:DNA polymerase-3 subunit epsilon